MKTNFSDILVEGIAIADPKLAQQYANAQKQLNDLDAQIIGLQKQVNTIEVKKTQIQKAMIAIEQKSAQTPVQAPQQPTTTTNQQNNQNTTTQPTAPSTTPSSTAPTKESYNDILKINKINEVKYFKRGLDPKDAMGIGDVEGRKKLIPFDQFAGLKELAAGFDPFEIIDYKRDPGYGYENVYMLFIHFINKKKRVPKWQQTPEYTYGLCIYDTAKEQFIEEPGSLDDYDITPEKLQRKYGWELPGHVYESTYDISSADADELEQIKNFMDSENIDYIESEDTLEFDENQLDPEWRSMLTDVGIKKLGDSEDDDFDPYDNDDMYVDNEVEEDVNADAELTAEEHEQINEDKVFYVQVEDEGEAFIGKIYKLKDDDEWLSKLVVGESETFDKLYYEPEWDEVDIIAFLRDNYADATIISEDEFNDDIMGNEEEIQEALNTTGRYVISKLDDYKGGSLLK